MSDDFLDSNVLIYHVDQADELKHRTADELVGRALATRSVPERGPLRNYPG